MPDSTYASMTERLLERCLTLAKISELKGAILRQYLTAQHQQANQQVAQWCEQEGLVTWQDEVGNQWARLASKNKAAPRLILGSHLDTVPNAGAYDGILGVLMAVEILTFFSRQPALPFHLDLVGFADEEGTRFGTTLIGSQALAANFNPQWLRIEDNNGITMAQAFKHFGLQTERISSAKIEAETVLGYWEVHIEQGPVLENQNQPLGIVTGIAGAKRATIAVTGKAGHAGTTPMNLRNDALSAAAELIQTIEQLTLACTQAEVATVGDIKVKPGAANVIAGDCELSLDVRALNDEHRDQLINQIETAANDMATRRKVVVNFHWYHQAPAVLCDQKIQDTFKQATSALNLNAPFLPSGAGHDAMAMAEVVPVGMLFVRSPKGLSHHPDEAVIAADVQLALATMINAVKHQAKALVSAP